MSPDTNSTASPNAPSTSSKRPRPAKSSPCPGCDAQLPAGTNPSCPSCGLLLIPVTVAGFFRRGLATIIDLALALVIAIPLQMLVHWMLTSPDLVAGGSLLAATFQLAAAAPLDIVIWAAPALGVLSLYYLLFLILMGYTPGQRLARIRVVNSSGTQPHPVRTTVRLFGAGLGMIPLGLGGVWIAFDREKRGLHDHIAGTYVVRVQ